MTSSQLQLTGIIALIGVIALMAASYEVYAAVKCVQARDWPTVIGQVYESRCQTSGSGKHRRKQLYFGYRYTRNSTSYKSSTVAFGSLESFDSGYVLKNYPKGRSVRVHVNPDKPWQAVLEPEFKTSAAIVFGVSIMALVTVIGIPVIACRPKRRMQTWDRPQVAAY